MVAIARVAAFLSRFRSTGTRVSGFGSRTVRNTVTEGEGVRTIAPPDVNTDTTSTTDNIFSFFSSVGGWIVGVVKGIGFTFTGLWSLFVRAQQFLWNFNWNISDREIDALLARQQVILASYLGGTLGNLAGYLVCGIVPAAGVLVFNEPLGAYLLAKVSEEAFEEFSANLGNLLRASFYMLVERAFYWTFKNVRKIVREFYKDPDSAQSRITRNILGSNREEALRNWGAEGSQPWSFAIAVEQWIESFNNATIEAFLEEFLEEMGDACIESGYVIANGLDSWVAMSRLTEETQDGAEVVVELQPNREVEGETIIVAAPRNEIRQALVSTMADHTLIDNRDVGMWVGEPVREYLRTDPISIQLVISLNSVQYSPHVAVNGKRGKRVVITIPNVSRTKIDWQTIKTAAGGTNGYLWGQYQVTARLTEGHKIQLYAATEQEAIDRVKAYALLSKSEILTINVLREVKEANRVTYDVLNKPPTKIYPIFFTIINQRRVLNEDSGRAKPSGVYKERRHKIPLNTDTKPDNFDELITDLFTIPGANS
ncbi:MAG: hypothetical protein ACRC2V_02085 [Xenococcaceae cyanobacterium]